MDLKNTLENTFSFLQEIFILFYNHFVCKNKFLFQIWMRSLCSSYVQWNIQIWGEAKELWTFHGGAIVEYKGCLDTSPNSTTILHGMGALTENYCLFVNTHQWLLTYVFIYKRIRPGVVIKLLPQTYLDDTTQNHNYW